MNKFLLILGFFCCFMQVGFAQDKSLRKANAALREANFKVADLKLKDFEEDNYDLFLGIPVSNEKEKLQNNINLAIYYYVKANFLFAESEFKNLEQAFVYFLKSKKQFEDYRTYNTADFNSKCVEFSFCDLFFSEFENKIEDAIYKLYTFDASLKKYESFLQKYYSSKNYKRIFTLRENLIIDEALKNNVLSELENAILLLPESRRVDELKLKIETILIDEAIARKDIKSIDSCLVAFPGSSRFYELEEISVDLKIRKAKENRDLKKLQEYLDKFPSVQRKREISVAIENIYIDSAKALNSIQFLEECLIKFPETNRAMEIKRKMEDIEIDNAIKLKSINNLNALLIKYPESPRYFEILKVVENLSIDEAILSGNVVKIEKCIEKFPFSERMKELKDALLLYK